MASQFSRTCSGVSALSLPEDVGMPADQLGVDTGSHVAQVVEPLLLGHAGHEVHLEEEVAQLAADRGFAALARWCMASASS